jgi:sterol desaturase/sphingolipid hydroxylase (fatty acid hydroxylase superfamily)
MDTTTSIRFHPVEFLLSSLVTVAQLWIIGWVLELFFIYELAVTLAVPYHHANLRLPRGWDKALQALFVTPQSHSIHHSRNPEETHSNFGIIFSCWDRAFRTFRQRGTDSPVESGLTPPFPEDYLSLVTAPLTYKDQA